MKNNKKGFTLVELLAVIAILAILVIIALPNIMDLFNDAKLNSFENEVKEIYKTAQSQWMSEALNGGSEVRYAKGTNCTSSNAIKQLNLSGRDDIQYSVLIDKTGKINYIAVTDGTFEYEMDEYIDVSEIKLDREHNINEAGTSIIRCITDEFTYAVLTTE